MLNLIKRLDLSDTSFPPIASSVSLASFLTAEEREKFLRVVSAPLLIRRHYQLFLWLQGELQYFLPHEIMISAWGHFPSWDLNLDIISALPGVRTHGLADCDIDGLLRNLFNRWVDNERNPIVVSVEDLKEVGSCECSLHCAIRDMRSILVHGVCDKRGGYDSLYVALRSESFNGDAFKERFRYVVEPLIFQIDGAFRKVAGLPSPKKGEIEEPTNDSFDLSPREREIMDWVCRGKTNFEIGAILSISEFTVKNHVKRILKKVGAINRTQAVAHFNNGKGRRKSQRPRP